MGKRLSWGPNQIKSRSPGCRIRLPKRRLCIREPRAVATLSSRSPARLLTTNVLEFAFLHDSQSSWMDPPLRAKRRENPCSVSSDNYSYLCSTTIMCWCRYAPLTPNSPLHLLVSVPRESEHSTHLPCISRNVAYTTPESLQVAQHAATSTTERFFDMMTSTGSSPTAILIVITSACPVQWRKVVPLASLLERVQRLPMLGLSLLPRIGVRHLMQSFENSTRMHASSSRVDRAAMHLGRIT